MKKNNFIKILKNITLLAIMITFMSIMLNLEVAQIISNEDASLLSQLEEKHLYSDISIICVQYTTNGTMWRLEESTTKVKRGDMLLLSLFDPRCLNDNAQFIIDFHYDFIVCTPKILSPLLNNKFKIVIPSKIYAKPRSAEIMNQSKRQFFHVSDLNFMGKIRIFLRSFITLFSLYIIFFVLTSKINKRNRFYHRIRK